MSNAILRVNCADRTGIVAALTNFVFRHGGNILDADQHSEDDRFFMRLAWSMQDFALERDGISPALQGLVQTFEDLHWQLDFDDRPQRIAVFCSKTPHCLWDLLLRQKMGELGGDIAIVVSNHPDLEEVVTPFGVPYHHLPITPDRKAEVEQRQTRLLEENEIDLVVLARYMQILTADFVNRWQHRIINIHHSFLPAFAGAKPYHQAKERGVKIIGASAHYVTAELDEGPIIEQDVCRVTHRDTIADLIRKGRDLERQVLGRAVRLHLHHNIIVHENRTVILV